MLAQRLWDERGEAITDTMLKRIVALRKRFVILGVIVSPHDDGALRRDFPCSVVARCRNWCEDSLNILNTQHAG